MLTTPGAAVSGSDDGEGFMVVGEAAG